MAVRSTSLLPEDLDDYRVLLLENPAALYYQMMGKLGAKAKSINWKDRQEEYQRLLLEALGLRTTPQKNSNVLQHILGYFKGQLSGDEKKEGLLQIEWVKIGPKTPDSPLFMRSL
jgi:uncharacterized protein YbgA (DUF1722 family)